MTPQRIGGMVLLAAGVVLFIIGMNATDSFADEFSNFFTGEYTDSTMWYLVGGGASTLAGVLMLSLGGRQA